MSKNSQRIVEIAMSGNPMRKFPASGIKRGSGWRPTKIAV
jgi:hypothetical protein